MFKMILVVVLFVNFQTGTSASVNREITDEEARILTNLASLEQNGDSADFSTPEKRYSQSYATQIKSNSFNQAAMRKFLTYIIGKRNSGTKSAKKTPEKRSGADSAALEADTLPSSDAPDLSAYVLILGKIDDKVLSEVINETSIN